MKSRLQHLACALLIAVAAAGCFTMQHTVGNGGSSGVQSSERAWYALWGLVPIHEVDAADLAGGATDYTIETEFTFVDLVIGFFTQLITIQPMSVTVTR